MEADQNAEPVNTPEYMRTTTDTCPTCISGTDPIIIGLGADILQDAE